MSTIDLYGKKVHIDDQSESAKHALKYLEQNPDNAKALLDEAHRNYAHDGVAHYEIPNMHTSEDSSITHHVTMIHNSDGTYTLQKRHGF